MALPLMAGLPLPAGAAFQQPQVASLNALRAASTFPVEIQFRGGFPVSVTLEAWVTGATPAARARTFLQTYAALFMQDHPDIELVHVFTDQAADTGTVSRFAQRYAGIPVFGAEIVVVERTEGPLGGDIVGVHGSLLVPELTDRFPPDPIHLDRVPAILPVTAETAARAADGAPSAAVRGRTTHVIYAPSVFGEAGEARLAYRVTVDGLTRQRYLVDANDGQVLARFPTAPTGAGLTDFDLDLEDANSGNIKDTNCFNPTTLDDEIGDEDGIGAAYLNDLDAVAAWNHARETYAMYHDVLGRHSYDDDDGELEVYVHAHLGSQESNARAFPGCGVEFSNGWVSMDVMAHEFSHLVIAATADFPYRDQPGALDESFSDIMGARVDTGDWLLGEDRTGGFGPVRDLKVPSNLPCGGFTCPDRMSQFVTTTTDNGGVHINSQIVSKAYQLMADGGSFNGRTITGFGRTKMARVAYRSVTMLAANATFRDARNGAVARARMFHNNGLHGFTTQDICTVRNAFAAVEIGFGDIDCDGVEDNVDDDDGDGILNDGDLSGSTTDNRCDPWSIGPCDDNCPLVPNPIQTDYDADGTGNACDPDNDNDGIPNGQDLCPFVYGEDSFDGDGDGLRNCVDPDDDGDGIPDDGDGSGDPTDNPCPSQVIAGCDDNCRTFPNFTQIDGDGNGRGDACDPDYDGDGLFADDNCVFTPNVSQTDSDADGLGDACDRCPFVPDNINAYTLGYPELGIPPAPLQPDSDGDGIPDACDFTWGAWDGRLGGNPISAFNRVRADGQASGIEMDGPPGDGSVLSFPIAPCDDGATGPGPNDRVELTLESFPSGLTGWIETGDGTTVARIRPSPSSPGVRGVRFRPRCDRDYYLALRPEAGFQGPVSFAVSMSRSQPTEANPWTSTPGAYPDPPPPLADADGDGLLDGFDTCPVHHDPTNLDTDGDGRGDVCDDLKIYGIKSCGSHIACGFGDASGAPSMLFTLGDGGQALAEIAPLSVGGALIDADGLAMSSAHGLLGFELLNSATGPPSGSRLVSIDPATAEATPIGPELAGREIRGASFDAQGRLWGFDSNADLLLQIDVQTGAVAGSPVPLTLDGIPFNGGTISDLATRADGQMFFVQMPDLYTLDPAAGTLALSFHDSAPDGENVLPTSAGAAFSPASPLELVTYDVSGYDDILKYDTGANYARTLLHPNILAAFNSGRGSLASELPDCSAFPKAVSNLMVATAGGGSQLHLTWDDVPAATSYAVFRDTVPDGSFAQVAGAATSGATGVTLPMPAGDVFFLVSGVTAPCVGPKR